MAAKFENNNLIVLNPLSGDKVDTLTVSDEKYINDLDAKKFMLVSYLEGKSKYFKC